MAERLRAWSKGSDVIYEIYPRSLSDSNGDGIGDIPGMTRKLDYIHRLGATAIWSSPFYKSPRFDNNYDVSDYRGIDPIFGSMRDVDELIAESHERGIKFLLDFVPNHTSQEHPWFVESRSSRTNPKRDWYIWADPKRNGTPPNNWLSDFGGSIWEYDGKRGQYCLHSFLKQQPDLNWQNPEVREAMLEEMRFWIEEKKVDGFRIDAVHFLMKDPQLRDEPANPDYVEGRDRPVDALLHTRTRFHPDMFGQLHDITEFVGEYPNKFVITEAYGDLNNIMKMYESSNARIHAPFNMEFIFLPWEAGQYKEYLEKFYRSVGGLYLPVNVLGNLDRPRVASRVGEKGARLAVMLEMTLRGMAVAYYGDEIGMTDVPIPPEKQNDPLAVNLPGLNQSRDPARTPMQWNDQPYAGFSIIEPWLPVSDNYREVNVQLQESDPASMLNLYKKLIEIKKNSNTLNSGGIELLDLGLNNVLGYVRELDGEQILVMLNYSTDSLRLTMGNKPAQIICSTYMDRDEDTKINLSGYMFRPEEGLIFKL